MLLSRPDTDNLRHAGDPQVRCYSSRFSDAMEMLSPAETVASSLDNHQAWFQRCATPMTVQAIDQQSYALTLGQFGNFGFEVEPTIALRLLPQQSQVYRIETVRMLPQSLDLRDHYDVDFQASMRLLPGDGNNAGITSVQWDLDLPPQFAVQRQLASIVRVRTEAVLQAEDPATGAAVKLLLLPFGQQAGASLNADEQFSIASYIYNGEGDAASVGKTLQASAARSPGIVTLMPQGAPMSYTAGGGRRYLRYGYVAEKCAGELDGGADFCTASATSHRCVGQRLQGSGSSSVGDRRQVRVVGAHFR